MTAPPDAAPRIVPFGDRAWLLCFGEVIDEAVNARVVAIADAIDERRRERRAGLERPVVAYASLLLAFDPARIEAAEVFQLDVSQGLALAVLALIAILPEYVVDATFAWLAAEEPSYAAYAVANMTGANRLLIGIAWPLVIVIVWLRTRRDTVELEPTHGVDVGTKADVHRTISHLAAGGLTILLISSELLEVLGMSDRVLVMKEGQLVDEIAREDATEERIIKAAAGIQEAA